jgi:hypothetical protein|tara:strand:+ start:5252 stop:7096 length:1845 start_codon:yes stop_codon:yes gene_type:complete
MAINANNFFNLEQEARTQGTLGGKKLTPEQRKEAFKKQGKIEFKTFVEKVLNKKEPMKSVAPKSLGGGATKALPAFKAVQGAAPEKSEVAQRVANAFDSRLDDLLKNIREDVGGILAVVEKQTDIDEEQAVEEKQENEKAKRKAKEEKSESKDKKPKTSGFLKTLTKPVMGLWESIVKGFTNLLLGWGLTKFLTWFGNPKNRENVEAFKEFVVNAVPVILKGILALIALDIGLKVLKFVKILALGSSQLLAGLLGLSKKIGLWALANPWIAGAIGLGLVTYGIGKMLNKDKEGENLAEAQNQSTKAIIDEGDMNAGEADVLSQSVVTTDSNRMSNTNLRSNNDMLQLRNDPLGGGFNKFNEGGFVSGPEGVDRVPAKLTAGEFVMSKGAVQEYGTETLAGMNAAGGGTNRPKGNKFEGGGLVGNLNTMTKSKGPSEGGLGMTGGGKNFIGSDQKNLRFTGPKKEAYFLRVKKKTGEIQIWNEEFLSDKFIGSMDPNTKKIDYNNNLWGGARGFEKDFFNKQKNKQMVLSRASNLIKKSSVAGEITEKKADQLINNPPGKQKKGKVIPVTTGGGGGGSQGGGGGETPQELMFSAIDKQNHYRSMVAAMCNILEDV